MNHNIDSINRVPGRKLNEQVLIAPLIRFNGRVPHIIFSKLPLNGIFLEVVSRVIVLLLSIVIYPVLCLAALVGLATYGISLLCVSDLSKRTNNAFVLQTQVSPSLPVMNAVAVDNPFVKKNPLLLPHEREIGDEELAAKQEIIENREIPLHVCPKRPQKSFPVDRVKAEAYRSKLLPPYQAVFDKVMKNLMYISMEMFDVELHRCIIKLNEYIDGQAYSIGFVAGKSSQWVASLALKDLETLPESWFPLGMPKTLTNAYNIVIPDQQFELPANDELPLVIFDDCGYSGLQLMGIIIDIAKRTVKPRKLFVVVPFMTKRAKCTVENGYRGHLNGKAADDLEIVLITSEKCIPMIYDGFSEMDDYMKLDEISVLHMDWNNIIDPSNNTLCYTDWRIPDFLSFREGFGSSGMKILAKERGRKSSPLPRSEWFMPVAKDVPRPYAF